MKELDGCDVLINLAGRSVNCRYTEHNRREIMESRVNSTQILTSDQRLPAAALCLVTSQHGNDLCAYVWSRSY